ncbi:hypothetical protein K432DRAFT_396963 [Lepidopterella palustris CBS 459.81]|uniref:Uncharacterized protein n=1 Tax=Lepidopterella palustris CBS 459.81 TaxID=1314670 RepID=A0A8E2E1S3_9PEZI|nr:hypothetical protein K432DRAFT_396963 [Lepidopterella palustris CBS 459.81]
MIDGHVEDRVITWFDQRYAAGDGQFQFSYGPGNTWVACTSAGGYWSGGDISDTIELQTKDFWPVKATLGISGSYVLVDADGRRKWDLKGKYDNLDNILLNTTLGIEAVALNPYEEGQFFIRFQSGGWRAWLHASNLDEVSKAMNEAFEYEAQIMQMRNNALLEQARTMAEIASRNLAAPGLTPSVRIHTSTISDPQRMRQALNEQQQESASDGEAAHATTPNLTPDVGFEPANNPDDDFEHIDDVDPTPLPPPAPIIGLLST